MRPLWRHLPEVTEDGDLCARCEKVVRRLTAPYASSLPRHLPHRPAQQWAVTGPLGLTVEGDQRYVRRSSTSPAPTIWAFRSACSARQRGRALVLVASRRESACRCCLDLREPRHGDRLALGLVLAGLLEHSRSDRLAMSSIRDLHFGAFRPFLVFNHPDAAIASAS